MLVVFGLTTIVEAIKRPEGHGCGHVLMRVRQRRRRKTRSEEELVWSSRCLFRYSESRLKIKLGDEFFYLDWLVWVWLSGDAKSRCLSSKVGQTMKGERRKRVETSQVL